MFSAGRYDDTESCVVHDHGPDETCTVRAAHIASFVSFSSVCSFYNEAGQIQGDAKGASSSVHSSTLPGTLQNDVQEASLN